MDVCMCMYVYVCVCMCVCMYVCIHACVYGWMCMNGCLYVCVCMYVCNVCCMYEYIVLHTVSVLCFTEVLGALLSVFLIWLVSGILCYIAVERIIHEHYKNVKPNEMLITACLGVAFNVM